MECAIGEADGSISHYLDKIEYNKAADRRFEQDANFDLSTNRFYTTPFCLAFEREGIFSCLYGAVNGKVYFIRNTPATDDNVFDSNDMEHIGQMFDTKKMNSAPFCADFDGDNDIDCIVGYDDGAQETGVQLWKSSCGQEYCALGGKNYTKKSDNFFATAPVR